ncbi:hypothetical protein NLJ89_g8339 [Agrocybe chaxingu]|uniref:Uncharacterized protein n=1 Tax=Agrocybe chaxingu TaxID=84603 RepID=A0A9W8JXM4_9AGAR|nr:hypothetical protein NLJ89_g8339 [Agrocybe chaxingu]
MVSLDPEDFSRVGFRAEPIEYLEEIDNRILHAVATGNTGSWLATPLCLARGETSFIASVAKQLRSDQGVLRDIIREEAYNRSETIPDLNGNAPNVETDMLANSSYLAQEVRYVIHNTLLQLGQWYLVSDYLKDVVEHDEKYGREERVAQRQALMNSARFVVEQGIEIVSRKAGQAIRKHPKFAKLWVRHFSYEPKWTGARIEVKSDPNSQAQLDALVQAQYALIKDLCERFAKANQSELDELGESIVEYDFYLLLGVRHPEEQFFTDKRLRQFKDNSETAQGILNKTALERHIKGLESLASEATLKKIWGEIDKLSPKKATQTVEKLIGYQKLPSRWYTRVLPPRPPPSPPSSEPTPQPRRTRSRQTVGVPNEQSEVPPDEEKVEKTLTKARKVLFYVKKYYYNIVEKIFKPGAVKGQLDQDDFMKASSQILEDLRLD